MKHTTTAEGHRRIRHDDMNTCGHGVLLYLLSHMPFEVRRRVPEVSMCRPDEPAEVGGRPRGEVHDHAPGVIHPIHVW